MPRSTLLINSGCHVLNKSSARVAKPGTHGLSLTAIELISSLQNRFRPSARPSDPDTMTNTGLEAIASSNGKKTNQT